MRTACSGAAPLQARIGGEVMDLQAIITVVSAVIAIAAVVALALALRKKGN